MRLLNSILGPLIFAAPTAALIAQPVVASADSVSSETLLVEAVALVDLEAATVSPPQDLLIVGGKIASIGPRGSINISDGMKVVDGRGLFALPGLIDVHAHVGEGGAGPNSEEARTRALLQFLRYGVTTIFAPGATGAGDADLPALLQRCRSGALTCPGVFGTGSIITARGSHPLSTIFGMPDDVASEITEARGVTAISADTDIPALIARKKAAGATAIKIVVEDGPPPWYPKPRLSDEQIEAIVTAAHASSLPVVAHISTAQQVDVVVEAGADAIMHAPTDLLPTELIEKLAARGTWYVPTFSLYDGILSWARGQRESDPYALSAVDASVVESLASPGFLESAAEDEAGALTYLSNASENLRRIHRAGVPLALGTDVNNPFVYPGYSVHEELSLMVRAGLTPAQALRSATSGGAAFLGQFNRIGKLAPGFEADIILTSGNPLESIENTRRLASVISDGRVISDTVAIP